MTRLLSLAAAAAVLAVPMSASAQGADVPIAAFKKVCWDTAGDYMQVLKAAAGDNWTKTDVTATSEPNVSITDTSAQEKNVNGVGITLLITRGLRHTSGGDFKVATCKMTVNKADEGLVAAAHAWVGADSDSGDKTSSIYFVKMGPGKPDHIGQSGTQTAMNSSGGFGVLKFQQDDNDAILVYQVYAK